MRPFGFKSGGAPFDMVSPQVATEVDNKMGNAEEVEQRRRQDTPNLFMRVHVALPISKPLRRGGFIADSEGVRTWVKFKYERLPIFCHFCGLLKHDLRHYASHFTGKKNGGVEEYQYGKWLKASGGRPRSPLLAKRACTQVDSLSKLQEEETAQTMKKGKVDWGKKKIDETSARVDYHPCRKQ